MTSDKRIVNKSIVYNIQKSLEMTHLIESKADRRREKRERLSQISEEARILREEYLESGEISETEDVIRIPLNYFIADVYGIKYDNLKTFSQWKKLGFTIKKGEQAYLFWGQPKRYSKQDETDSSENATEDEEKMIKYFPLCYLFCENQVFRSDVAVSQ